MNKEELKQRIINTFKDRLMDFGYYDRKEDEELPVGSIGKALKNDLSLGVDLIHELVNFISNEMKGESDESKTTTEDT